MQALFLIKNINSIDFFYKKVENTRKNVNKNKNGVE